MKQKDIGAVNHVLRRAITTLSVLCLLLVLSAAVFTDNTYAAGTNPTNATSISFGKDYYGSFTGSGEGKSQYFKFKTTGNKNDKYVLRASFVEKNSGYLHVWLKDDDYDFVNANGQKGTDYDARIDLHAQGDAEGITFQNLKINETYYIQVRCYNISFNNGLDKYAVSVKKITEKSAGKAPTGKATILNTIANSSKKTNDVIWDKSKVKGATNYQIYWRKRGASAWSSKTVGNTVRGTTNNLTIGGLYEIRVRPKKAETSTTKAAYGAWSNTIYRYFHTTQKIRLASKSKGSFTMSWAKNSAATSYQVMFTVNKNGAGAAKNIRTVTGTSCTVSGLKSGVTYYVQVREIKKVGNINYIGNISCPVAVKVK